MSPLIIKRATMILMFLVPLGQTAIDIYTPSLPFIASNFQVSQATVQETVSIYMIALGISQFLSGFAIKLINKKVLFIYSTLLFLFGSIICLLSPSMAWFKIGRCLEGLAGGASTIIVNNYLSEFYSGKEFDIAISRTSIMFSIAPIIMPYVGGMLQFHYDWRANFSALAGYSLLILVLGFLYLPNNPVSRANQTVRQIANEYKTVLFDIKFLSILCILIVSYSYQILFVSIAPFILQKQFYFTAYQYGTIALYLGVAYFLGASLNTYLLKLVSKIKLTTISVILVTTIIVLIQLVSSIINIWVYLALLGLLIFATGPLFPNGMSSAFERHKTRMGAASSLLGIAILIGASLINTITTNIFHVNSLITFSTSYFAITLILLLSYLVFIGIKTPFRYLYNIKKINY